MQTVVAKFPGGGITYLTITDPIVYDSLLAKRNHISVGLLGVDSMNVDRKT